MIDITCTIAKESICPVANAFAGEALLQRSLLYKHIVLEQLGYIGHDRRWVL